ncbi:MAG: membrane protein insertion efficiency factor YidD [Kiritimatiellae bacterium]|nr:membrane protein insertion efficiency factor YidD [Kiritimatiellia bacterium]
MAGILFFAPALCARAGMDLAAALYEEEDWSACRTESLRVLQQEPENGSARLFAALAALKLGRGDAAADLEQLAAGASDREVMAAASYECGRLALAGEDAGAAYAHFKKTFETTASYDLFLRSGCSLYMLTEKEKSLREQDLALALQLQTSRRLWSRDLMTECGPPEKGGGMSSLPGKWIVAFYRSQINPAIGARCSLTPSCSEYFRQACRAHGLLGFAIQADRFFREPSEVAARRNPVPVGDVIKYADPLEDHTKWLKK